ncbi:MAG: putative homoserine kinase [Pseudomonadota bacterium]|jgi:homoserine kinase type II
MAVFTEVSADAAGEFLRELRLGDLVQLQGIQGGIENTNYFVTSEQDGHTRQWVLTLFERLTSEQLPFYLYLMKHLAQRGIPVPDPQGNTRGDLLHTLCGKPAALVDRLHGRSELAPTEVHCAGVGDALARMHLAARDYDRVQPNLRGLAWWNETVPVILPFLDAGQSALLQGEMAFQNHVAASAAYASLPRGPVHADLFRDNVMFEAGPAGPELTGIFDFYFAGVDTWLFDLAVCLNDWCIDLPTGADDAARASALLRAYGERRPLTAAERRLLPAMRRAGALRFWISRLWDLHLPREASMLKPHDPTHFERVLRQRVAHPVRA